MPETNRDTSTREEAGDESPGLFYGNHPTARVLSSACPQHVERCLLLLMNIRARDTPRTGSARVHPESTAKPSRPFRFVCQTSHFSTFRHLPPTAGNESHHPRHCRRYSAFSVSLTIPHQKHDTGTKPPQPPVLPTEYYILLNHSTFSTQHNRNNYSPQEDTTATWSPAPRAAMLLVSGHGEVVRSGDVSQAGTKWDQTSRDQDAPGG